MYTQNRHLTFPILLLCFKDRIFKDCFQINVIDLTKHCLYNEIKWTVWNCWIILFRNKLVIVFKYLSRFLCKMYQWVQYFYHISNTQLHTYIFKNTWRFMCTTRNLCLVFKILGQNEFTVLFTSLCTFWSFILYVHLYTHFQNNICCDVSGYFAIFF